MKKTFLVVFILFSCSSAFGAGYIGSKACLDCHDKQEAVWKKSPHLNCESCHGPGSAHEETNEKKDIIGPDKIKSAVCGKCHNLPFWEGSIHAQSDYTCIDCHNPHNVDNHKLLKEKNVKSTCSLCHGDNDEIFREPVHGNDKITCANCHLPHGSKNSQILLKDGVSERWFCQRCHSEEPHHFIINKRTVKMNNLNCIDCHKVHSTIKKHIKQKKEDLCSSCHKKYY